MRNQKSKAKKHMLVLGWRTTPALEPRYWLDKSAQPGHQSPDDLILAPAAAMANHTAIIAQSGSGKSFFLGRLIEEIIIRTKARCVILDPNSDFRLIRQIDKSVWENPQFDSHQRLGKLPHESAGEFKKLWAQKEIRVRGSMESPEEGYKNLTLPLTSIEADFLAEELDADQRSDLVHCHQTVRHLEKLQRLEVLLEKGSTDGFLELCAKIFTKLRSCDSESKLKEHLRTEFAVLNKFQTAGWKKSISLGTLRKLWAAVDLEIYENSGIPREEGLDIIKAKAVQLEDSVVTVGLGLS
jgi:hypothetical protein